jgi:hypothetical protein
MSFGLAIIFYLEQFTQSLFNKYFSDDKGALIDLPCIVA